MSLAPWRRPVGVFAIVVAGVATLMGAQSATPPPPSFRSSAEVVRVDVSVRRNGRPVTNLTAGDFLISDNGVAQTVTDFSYEKGAIDVTVALDLSRSVSGTTLDRLRRGVDELRKRLSGSDRLKVVTFNMRVRRLLGFDDPSDRVGESLAGATAGGGTSLLDTIAVLLAAPAPLGRRQIIIVFSDGADTSSLSEPDTVLAVAARTTPTVAFVRPGGQEARLYTAPTAERSGVPQVGVGSGSMVVDRGRNVTLPMPAIYRELAAETGGTVIQTSGENLSGSFARLLDDFRSSYLLHYTPVGVPGAGFHSLGVKLRREGTFDVRARRGYVR